MALIEVQTVLVESILSNTINLEKRSSLKMVGDWSGLSSKLSGTSLH